MLGEDGCVPCPVPPGAIWATAAATHKVQATTSEIVNFFIATLLASKFVEREF